MKPIVTLTLNPAIDGAADAEHVHPVRKIRTSNERYDPGGGGINVARVVEELGGQGLAVYLSGGAPGPILDALLDRTGIPRRRIPIEGDTRISHTVHDRSSGLEYRFVPEGPLVRPSELDACTAALEELDFDFLVASGSLPRGVPPDFYARVAELCRRKSAKLVLDTSGKPLRQALHRGVFMMKPSLGEFEAIANGPIAEAEAQDSAAQALVRSGAVEVLAVSLGHRGALLATHDGTLRLTPPPVVAKSAVGAGDSFVGSMVLALAQGRPIEDAFMRGVAAGTAAVLSAGTELCKRADVERLYAELQRSALPQPSPR